MFKSSCAFESWSEKQLIMAKNVSVAVKTRKPLIGADACKVCRRSKSSRWLGVEVRGVGAKLGVVLDQNYNVLRQ
ncbi:hypothetical protein TNCV_4686251 [Trichonephila clavipes]|nr:hypothetical protein TNCV_4686251 [Trichonephila clavipes]